MVRYEPLTVSRDIMTCPYIEMPSVWGGGMADSGAVKQGNSSIERNVG